MDDTEPRITEFHDDGPDKDGKRRFTVRWLNDAFDCFPSSCCPNYEQRVHGRVRAQEFHADPSRFKVGPVPKMPKGR